MVIGYFSYLCCCCCGDKDDEKIHQFVFLWKKFLYKWSLAMKTKHKKNWIDMFLSFIHYWRLNCFVSFLFFLQEKKMFYRFFFTLSFKNGSSATTKKIRLVFQKEKHNDNLFYEKF